MAPPGRLIIRQALALPSFRKLWLGQLVSIFGDFLALYAVLSEMSFRMHGSARALPLVSVSYLLPIALLGPLAGVFVDRWNSKRPMVVSDFARAALALGLVIAGVPWHIYLVFVAISAFSSFFMPARSVVLPQIVPKEGLMSANAAIQQTMQLVQMASPAVAGALVGWAGPSSCYYLDSASFVFSGLMIWTMAIPERPAHPNQQMRSVLQDLFSGVRYILTHPVMSFVILSIAAGTFAISAFGSLIAVFVRDVLHANSFLFGALGSLIGAGMLSGGVAGPPLGRPAEEEGPLLDVGNFFFGGFLFAIAFVLYTAESALGAL